LACIFLSNAQAAKKGSEFCQGAESPNAFILRVEWETLEAHVPGFRQSPLLTEWRSHFYHLLDGTPVVTHYVSIAAGICKWRPPVGGEPLERARVSSLGVASADGARRARRDSTPSPRGNGVADGSSYSCERGSFNRCAGVARSCVQRSGTPETTVARKTIVRGGAIRSIKTTGRSSCSRTS
jgi:hypothetical protein